VRGVSTVFRAEGRTAGARADYWRQVLADTIGPLEPHGGLPDEILAGDAGPVRVARSAIAMVGALVLPRGIAGITEASTTRSASTPRTRSSGSQTVSLAPPIAWRAGVTRSQRDPAAAGHRERDHEQRDAAAARVGEQLVGSRRGDRPVPEVRGGQAGARVPEAAGSRAVRGQRALPVLPPPREVAGIGRLLQVAVDLRRVPLWSALWSPGHRCGQSGCGVPAPGEGIRPPWTTAHRRAGSAGRSPHRPARHR
jgi:hypothetical protein